MFRRLMVAVSAVTALTGFTAGAAPALPAAPHAIPRPDHVVVVMEENHSYGDVIGSSSAPYINSLAAGGASFTQSFAVTHPSEPNYLAIFSGSTQGLSDDSCPHTFTGANLGQEAIGAGLTFTGYSETMPSAGYTGCTSGNYARKHNPWVNFTTVPAASNQPFTTFPSDFTTLPTVSFVIPNLQDDMHDGTVQQGDTWLRNHMDAYAQWAKTHNSLLVVTWDEDDNSANNQIPTIISGAGVTAGNYSETINHYNVLRTLEDAYGLPRAGASASATPITDIFTGQTGGVTVAKPANQTGTVGVATSLQISATDTATGTLSYAATGLPAGLSINSSTGLVSGTPTTAGSSTVTVTATDSTGPSGSTTFSWTVNPVAGNTVTVTNPGNQTGTVGTAASLQIHATDSASGQTLTYRASGLPAGLSINSSTGLISGTPTTAGSSTVTVTVVDSTNASSSTTFGWTVGPASGGCTATQLFGNPGFETGSASPWTATASVVSNDSSESPHSGTWYAWLDGYGSTHTDTLAQTVTLPAGCSSYQLGFWLHIDTAETTTTAQYDKLTAQVLTASGTVLGTLATFSNLNHNTGYAQHTYDLSAYAGQTITIKLTGTEDSTKQTSFVLDDTALTLS